MEITGKFLLRCMRHTFIWALDTFIMCATYHLQHLIPPIPGILIMAVGIYIFVFYMVRLAGFLACILCGDELFKDEN